MGDILRLQESSTDKSLCRAESFEFTMSFLSTSLSLIGNKDFTFLEFDDNKEFSELQRFFLYQLQLKTLYLGMTSWKNRACEFKTLSPTKGFKCTQLSALLDSQPYKGNYLYKTFFSLNMAPTVKNMNVSFLNYLLSESWYHGQFDKENNLGLSIRGYRVNTYFW